MFFSIKRALIELVFKMIVKNFFQKILIGLFKVFIGKKIIKMSEFEISRLNRFHKDPPPA